MPLPKELSQKQGPLESVAVVNQEDSPSSSFVRSRQFFRSPFNRRPSADLADSSANQTQNDNYADKGVGEKFVIALLGPSGSGKSSFIAHATSQNVKIGHLLAACTDSIDTYEKRLLDGRSVVFVDTPGYDLADKNPNRIPNMLAQWLKTQNVGPTLNAILFFHRITDNRMPVATQSHLGRFEKLVGRNGAPKRILLITTMWDEVDPGVGSLREEQLKLYFWKRFMDGGSSVHRFKRSNSSAWEILNPLVGIESEDVPLPSILDNVFHEEVEEEEDLDTDQALRTMEQIYLEQQRLLERLQQTVQGSYSQQGQSLEEVRAAEKDVSKRLELLLARLKRKSKNHKKNAQDQFQNISHEVKKSEVPVSRRLQMYLRQKIVDKIKKGKGEPIKSKEMADEIKRLTKEREREREKEWEKEREIVKLSEQDRQRRMRLEVEKEKVMKKAVQLEKLLESLRLKSLTSLNSSTSDLSNASVPGDPEDSNDYERSTAITLVSELTKIPEKHRLLVRLEGAVAQSLVDFLNQVLDQEDLESGDRKHITHLLCTLAKSAQVFPRCFKLKGVECDLTRSVDEGGFGCIYKGTFRDRAVSVKTIRVYQGGVDGRALRAQAAEMTLLANTSHPNVLPFYGLYRSKEKISRICLVSPWMEGGSLANYLKTCSANLRVPLLLDIASGLNYLHELGIIHSDLKASNVLVTGERAVLADFGISRIAMTQATTTGAGTSYTANWMAPELFTARSKSSPTRASDMWSFGCTCYEVMTGDIPFAQYNQEYQLILALKNDHVTPSRPDTDGGPGALQGTPGWLRGLAERCWDFNPEGRPTAGEVYQLIFARLEGEDNRPTRDVEFSKILATERAERTKRRIDYVLVRNTLQRVLGDHHKENEHRTRSEQARLANEDLSWLVSRRRQICQAVEHSVFTSRFPFS